MTRDHEQKQGFLVARRALLKSAGAIIGAAGLPSLSALAKQAGVMRVGLGSRDMGSLHPHVATGSNDTPIIDSVFSGLLRYASPRVAIDGIEPDLAERWEASSDHKTYTFHLRKGAKWHKGYGEVTSEDVKYSLAWVRENPQSTFKPLYGNIERVETPDPYTVVISLKNVDPVFPIAVANWQGGYMICKKASEELGDKYKNQPIGSGPFQFESYRPKDNVTLSANPDYYFGKPKLDRVIFSYIPDETSRRFAFVQQEVDVIQGQASEEWLAEIQKSTPGGAIVDLLGPSRVTAIHMKKSVKPLDNLDVRKAIAHAINRDDYVQFFGRVFQPSFTAIPADYFGTMPQDRIPKELIYEFDPDKSKALLKSAGFAGGFKLETVVSERSDYLNLAQIAREQLAAVGIDLKLNVMDHGSWIAAIIKEKKGSLVWSTASRFPSAELILREFWLCSADVTKPSGVQGFAEYCNPTFDSTYQAGIESFDPAIRAKNFQEAQLIELKDVPSVPLGGLTTPTLRQGYVDLGYKVEKDKPFLSLPYMYHLNHLTSVG
ncbi:ABC transporter substrate-binding protein [Terrarubrum flagellatum]|uniref:ABC transporter substrate-binding protein n=1 Tax=Terrirubrum flagellatum TaxID=2895980 RepID=UPI003144DB62